MGARPLQLEPNWARGAGGKWCQCSAASDARYSSYRQAGTVTGAVTLPSRATITATVTVGKCAADDGDRARGPTAALSRY